VRRAAGSDVGPQLPELAQTISYLTEGNAFLLCELWRTLLETAVVAVVDGSVTLTRPLAELETPDSVREVVSQRLARVAPATGQLLELAAVAGPEFEHAVLKRAAELDEGELRPALDEAVRSGLIEEVQSGTLGYRFTHELVRWALYDGLTTLRRAELHLRVGEALEAVHASSSTPPLADLAHHFTAAAPVGASPRAVEYNIRAAEAAAAALAFEETAARLEKALDLGVENDHERANVLVELGTAYYRAGKWLDAHEAFSSAAELARTLGDADILARSAIGFEEACWRPKIYDRDALEMLEEAAAALGERESPTRVLVLAGLSRSLADLGNQERAGIVRDNAIGIARRIGDPRALGRVLLGAYWARGSSTHDEILEMLTEAKQLGEELGDEELRAEAVAWRVLTLVAQCELTAAHAELATLLEAAEQTRQPFMLHVADQFSSALALCDGRLAEAESRAESCYELSRAMTGWDASGVYGVQMFSLRREQGRLAELAPVIRLLAGGEEKPGVWRPGLVALLTELGMESEARRELARLRAEGLEQFRAALWLAALTYLTDASAALGEEEVAAQLYPELERYAGENVLIGYMVSCYGAADRYLGMLAATLGEWEKAEGHFEAALELNRRMGVSTWVAHSAYEYGRMLLRRGTADDTSHSRVLLAEAAALAEQIGMPVLLGRVQALGAAVAPASSLPDGLSAREAEILQLVAHGLSNREIGKALFISEHTAANHIRNILRKTGCANRTEAASYAHRHGLIEV
jgi:DNA-binding CsgD family transcriptional regulator/predicted ATPase